jgi:uncharacterized membrane protein YtjA (UPF0391 family)
MGKLRLGSALAQGLHRLLRAPRAGPGDLKKLEGNEMLHYALVFFLIAIVAAIFGFGGISVASAGIAKILFFLFLIVFLVSLVMGVARRA